MAEYSDNSPEATRIAEGQRERLVRLRTVVAQSQADACRAAGVGKDAWNRMEMGHTRISLVALARFCLAYEVPSEYVVTGSYNGLSKDFIELLVAAEAKERERAAAGAGDGASRPPAAKPAGTGARSPNEPVGTRIGRCTGDRRKKSTA